MLLRGVLDYCIRCTIWITVIIVFADVFFHPSGVVGLNTKLAFDEKKDVETIRIAINDNNEEIVASASDVDRRYSSRVKLFDDIFNIPISVLQSVNNLLQGLLGRPALPVVGASGWGRSSDIVSDDDSKV